MMFNSNDIGKLGEIATLFEVSGYPKPGNVHRTRDFKDMAYEDFLLSSVFIRDNLEKAANNGSKFYPNLLNEIGIGEIILRTVEETHKWAHTNTNLGIAMLMVPIAAAAGALEEETTFKFLPNTLNMIIKNSQPDDSIALVKSIVLSKAGGMDNKTNKYDVNNKNTIDEIRDNKINLYDILKMSSKYDGISYELVNKLPVITKVGFPTYNSVKDEYSRNDTTLETYLSILAYTPDTLISRKYGENTAQNVSKKAKEILNDTEIATDKRNIAIKEFDEYLYKKHYNPGTTADFTAASIFVNLLNEYSGESDKKTITY